MAKINPRFTPSPEAERAAADFQAKGGNITAEEIELSRRYEFRGWSPSRTGALRMAGDDGIIVGSAGSWAVYTPRVASLSGS
jgi:hypothetical protein